MAESDGAVLASNAEREHVIDALRRHTADGRLTMDEFEERVAEALAARTRRDLEPVLRALPPLPPAPSQPQARPRRLPRVSARQVAVVTAAAVAAVLFFQGAWWIIFPFWFVVLPMLGYGGCGARGRRAMSCGPGAWADRHRRIDRSGRWNSPRDATGTDVDDREIIRL
jgi:hypothetical protein